MECEIVRTTEGFEALRADWERIEQSMPGLTYFSTFRYNFLWWQSFYRNNKLALFLMVCRHNGVIVGIAPLQLTDIKYRFYVSRTLQFMHGGGDYSDFIVDYTCQAAPSNIVDRLLTEIDAHRNEYDEVWLTHISQYTELAHLMLTSQRNKDFQYLVECPYIDFSRYTDFESYTKAYQPKKIKQYVNRFCREVDYRMVVTSKDLIKDLAKVHIAEKNLHLRKGNIRRHSCFESEYLDDFFSSLYKDNSNILSYILYDNKTDEIICFYTGYLYKNIFHSATTAYNPNYAQLAVGKIFNFFIFAENSREPRWQLFDMGTGRYPWKFEMTDSFNLLYQYHTFVPRTVKIIRLSKLNSFLHALSKLRKQ